MKQDNQKSNLRMKKAECDFCGSFTLCATIKGTKSTICANCANPKRKFQEIIKN